nr:MAG TPA: hypothetical protein [Caudoviricetes sp.]
MNFKPTINKDGLVPVLYVTGTDTAMMVVSPLTASDIIHSRKQVESDIEGYACFEETGSLRYYFEIAEEEPKKEIKKNNGK